MTALLLTAAAVATLALFLLLRPMWSVRSDAAERAQQETLRDRLLRQLEELDAERAGTMDAAVAVNERARLEYELAQVLKRLEQLPSEATAALPARKSARAASILLAVLVPAAAAGLYGWQNRAAIGTFAQARPGAAGEQPLPPMVLEMVGRLEQRLKAQPNDAAGWAQLGRSYSVLNRREDALAAYAKAYAQAPNDLDIVSDYAWLAYTGDPRQPQPLAVKLYRQIYDAEPNNQDALWVLGLASYQTGNIAETKKLWRRLLAGLPPNTPAEQGVRSALQQLEQQAPAKTPAKPAARP